MNFKDATDYTLCETGIRSLLPLIDTNKDAKNVLNDL